MCPSCASSLKFTIYQEESVYDPLWRPDLPDFEDHDKDPDNSLPLANKYLDVSPSTIENI